VTRRTFMAALAVLSVSCAHYATLVTVPVDSADASILIDDAYDFLADELPPATTVLVFPRDSEALNGGLREACTRGGYALALAYGPAPARRVWVSFRRAGGGYLLEVDLGGVAMTRWYTRTPSGKLVPAGPRAVRRAS
jgi:hypothetical protein